MRGGIQVGPPGVTRTSGPRLATLAPVRLGGPMIRFNAVGMPLKILCGAALVPHQTKLNNADICRPAPLSHSLRWRLRQSNQQRFHPRAGNRVGVGVLSSLERTPPTRIPTLQRCRWNTAKRPIPPYEEARALNRTDSGRPAPVTPRLLPPPVPF